MARHLEICHAPGGEIADLAGACRVPLTQNDRGRDLLAQLGVRHGEGHHLCHGRMVHQHAIDLERADLLAATVDDLLEASGEVQIAVLIKGTLVAGAEPRCPSAAKKLFALASGLPS